MEGNIKMVIGLGNPGKDYVGTRHNVGFEVLQKLSENWGNASWGREKRKWKAEIAKAEGVILVKPLTYMNLSGLAVSAVSRFYGVKPEEMLVVFDDVALDLGILRFRMNGGSGGHNGIKSLIQHLGTGDFKRLKVGVGSPDGDMVRHVLGRFRTEECEVLENSLERAVKAVQLAVEQGVPRAANEFNG